MSVLLQLHMAHILHTYIGHIHKLVVHMCYCVPVHMYVMCSLLLYSWGEWMNECLRWPILYEHEHYLHRIVYEYDGFRQHSTPKIIYNMERAQNIFSLCLCLCLCRSNINVIIFVTTIVYICGMVYSTIYEYTACTYDI